MLRSDSLWLYERLQAALSDANTNSGGPIGRVCSAAKTKTEAWGKACKLVADQWSNALEALEDATTSADEFADARESEVCRQPTSSPQAPQNHHERSRMVPGVLLLSAAVSPFSSNAESVLLCVCAGGPRRH